MLKMIQEIWINSPETRFVLIGSAIAIIGELIAVGVYSLTLNNLEINQFALFLMSLFISLPVLLIAVLFVRAAKILFNNQDIFLRTNEGILIGILAGILVVYLINPQSLENSIPIGELYVQVSYVISKSISFAFAFGLVLLIVAVLHWLNSKIEN